MSQASQDLFQRHRHRVYTFACYCLGDPADAEDVTQEVLIKLWRHRRRIDERKVAPWLIRVTRNACIDEGRRRRGERRRNPILTDDESLGEIPSTARNPEALATSAQFLRRLEQALRLLPEPFRSVLVLREVQELKYDEIAAALGMPLNTVKVYLHRGRRMLREHLRDWRSDPASAVSDSGGDTALEGEMSHVAP